MKFLPENREDRIAAVTCLFLLLVEVLSIGIVIGFWLAGVNPLPGLLPL